MYSSPWYVECMHRYECFINAFSCVGESLKVFEGCIDFDGSISLLSHYFTNFFGKVAELNFQGQKNRKCYLHAVKTMKKYIHV